MSSSPVTVDWPLTVALPLTVSLFLLPLMVTPSTSATLTVIAWVSLAEPSEARTST